jgi:hypothetical protein
VGVAPAGLDVELEAGQGGRGGHRRVVGAGQTGRPHDLAPDPRHRVEGGDGLGDQGDLAAAQRPQAGLVQRLAPVEDLTEDLRVRREDPEHGVGQQRLARATRAHDRHQLAGVDDEVDAADHLQPPAAEPGLVLGEHDPQVPDLQHRRHSCTAFTPAPFGDR